MHLELDFRPVQIISGHVIYNSPYKYWPDKNGHVQLNEYETASYFLQLSQNMTSNCLFTFVFSPEFTCFVPKIVLNIKTKQFSVQSKWIPVRTGKNTKVNKQLVAMFWLDLRKYGSVSYSFTKYNHFLGVCWFLTKNISNFENLPWKFNIPYCHNGYHQKLRVELHSYGSVVSFICLFMRGPFKASSGPACLGWYIV